MAAMAEPCAGATVRFMRARAMRAMRENLRFVRLSALKTTAALSLLFAAALGSQTPSPDKGKQIVNQALAALGGDRFLHLQSRIASGRIYSFFHDQMNGYDVATIYTSYAGKNPAKGLAIRE